ncbi:MAG: hypothetical protein ABIP44_01160 [Pseudoxanthomonas sp.]
MSRSLLPVAFVLLAACASVVHAKERSQPLADCVDLSPDYQVARFGSQYLMVKDGDAYYRIGFGGSGCSAITLSSSVSIATDRKANRLCPVASKVKTRRDTCDAREVLRVDEVEYEKFARLQR